MCNYYESKMTFKGCEANPKHVIQRRNYDKCEEAKNTGYVCDDPAPAKGRNGEIILTGTYRKPGKCPRCLS